MHQFVLLTICVALPSVTFLLHCAACGLHVATVDGMRDRSERAAWQRGVGYRYCYFMSRVGEAVESIGLAGIGVMKGAWR
jgi:hypothetical protein